MESIARVPGTIPLHYRCSFVTVIPGVDWHTHSTIKQSITKVYQHEMLVVLVVVMVVIAIVEPRTGMFHSTF